MAEAMIAGIVSQKLASPEGVSVGEPVEERCNLLKERYGVVATTSNTKALEKSDLVILAVKPQNLSQVMDELKGNFQQEQVALSIVAGARMNTIMDGLGHSSMIRVMPNTPAQIGQGISLWTSSPRVKEAQRKAAQSILQTLGEEIYVEDEKYLDMATALSASGPAYVFLFIESLIDAGVHLGLPRDLARRLTIQTVLGSTNLLQQSGKHPAELRNDVTSPGGTTAEGLLALEEGGFRATVENGVIAAYQRALELGGEG